MNTEGTRMENKSSAYAQLRQELETSPRKWLVTGVAGFIGSNLLEALLKLNQHVVGLDNFATGKRGNLDQVRDLVTPEQWQRFRFEEGDVARLADCERASAGVEYVLHQAALGSVPRSIEEPLASHESNVTGCLNTFIAARDAKVLRVVYASSSSVYGDDPGLPKVEEKIGTPLSPYAATKAIDEIYAQAFASAYGLQSVGLRYFNVFGPRQDPDGAYAAVIPKWIAGFLKREQIFINGDGETSRDFCYIENVVQANLLAATTTRVEAINRAYNVALGERTTLNELFYQIQTALKQKVSLPDQKPIYREFRPGDVKHSLADIAKARSLLGYSPTHLIHQGLEIAMDWYRKNVV